MEAQTAWLIEDDLDLGKIFGSALQLAGYEVETLLLSYLAYQKLEEKPPDLLFLDLDFPGGEGRKLYRRIKSLAAFRKTHILIAASYPVGGDVLEDQVDRVLIKPIGFTFLVDLAGQLCAK